MISQNSEIRSHIIHDESDHIDRSRDGILMHNENGSSTAYMLMYQRRHRPSSSTRGRQMQEKITPTSPIDANCNLLPQGVRGIIERENKEIKSKAAEYDRGRKMIFKLKSQRQKLYTKCFVKAINLAKNYSKSTAFDNSEVLTF